MDCANLWDDGRPSDGHHHDCLLDGLGSCRNFWDVQVVDEIVSAHGLHASPLRCEGDAHPSQNERPLLDVDESLLRGWLRQ